MTGGALSAAGLLVAAVLLLAPARRLSVPAAEQAAPPPRAPQRRLLSATVAAGAVLLPLPRTWLIVAVVAAVLSLAVVRGLAARGRDRAALRLRGAVVDLCDALRSELVAGQTPAAALARAAEEHPFAASAARAATTGGDVVAALRQLANTPGAEALRLVAGAWYVAHRTGHGLADTLGRVAADLREAERTRRIVGGELASARATARLLATLPVLALLMGAGAGSDPLGFLLGEPVGLACLVGGLASGYAGLVWIEALARDVDRRG